jgi:hypothetical protein
MRERQRVYFKLIVCPHCAMMICWVNPRRPNYCCECGGRMPYPLGESVRYSDDDAELVIHVEYEKTTLSDAG